MKTILALVLAVSSLAIGPFAFGSNMHQEIQSLKQSCKGDIHKYCSDVTPGKGRILACLKAHDDKLSSACSNQWNQARQDMINTMKEMHAACSGDVQKFCSNAAGPGAIGNCLKSHESDLSASCKSFAKENMAG